MIYINDIPSLRNPESFDFNFDDRVENIELIGGNAVQDYGHISSGDTMSMQCVFSKANYNRLKALWTSRTRVSFTDEDGSIFTNLRLVFRKIRHVTKFPDYVILTFELWKV